MNYLELEALCSFTSTSDSGKDYADIFKKHLLEGNLEGIINNFVSDFIDIIVDDSGQRPLHIACQNGHLEIARFLINQHCDIERETEKKRKRPIHLACKNGHLHIARLLMENKCDIESEDEELMRPIHYCVTNGHFEIVKLLIEHNCNIECKTKKGLGLLQIACSQGHLPIVQLLARNKCLIQLKNLKKETLKKPAQKACVVFLNDFLNEINVTRKIFFCISKNDVAGFEKLFNTFNLIIRDYDSNLSVLEFAVENNAYKVIKFIRERQLNLRDLSYLMSFNGKTYNVGIQLLKECVFYQCIKDKYSEGFHALCLANIINGQRQIVQRSFLEVVTENGAVAFVDKILEKTIYEAKVWDKAKEIAIQNSQHQILNAILNREWLLKCREKANFTILHTAVSDNDPDMIKYILEYGLVDPNSNHEVVGTPLALSHMLSYKKCVEVLENFQVNTISQNKFMQTPLHEAISSGMEDNFSYLVEQTSDVDIKGFMGMTALHYAIIRGFEDLCLKLINRGADVNRYFQLPSHFGDIDIPFLKTIFPLSSKENSLTLCLKVNKTIYPCLLECLDPKMVNDCDDQGNSLLHLATKCFLYDVCKALVNIGANAEAINKQGNSVLLNLLCNLDYNEFDDNVDKIVEIVKLLVKYGADINKFTNDGITSLKYASRFHNETIMLALLSNNQNVLSVNEDMFKEAFIEKWFDYGETLLDLTPKHLLSSCISSEVINLALPSSRSSLLKSLFNKANREVRETVVENLLFQSIKDGDEIFFEYLIKSDVIVPRILSNGETILTHLLKNKAIKCCWKLLQFSNGKDFINLKNRNGKSPLHIAIDIEVIELIEYLVFDSTGLNNEDENGETPLMSLFKKMSLYNDNSVEQRFIPVIKSMISRGGDIYKVTSKGEKVIHSCTQPIVRSNIELFYKTEGEKLAGMIARRVSEVEKLLEIDKNTEIETKNCTICMDKEVDCALQCGHTICMGCSVKIFQCPFCKFQPINPKRIFFN